MKIVMATSSKNKFKESKEIAEGFGISLVRGHVDINEIRGTLAEIVEDKAIRSFELLEIPIICDDSGFFIDRFDGFPGPFSKFALEKIGNKGLLKLMHSIKERGAEFRCLAGFFDGHELIISNGVSKGTIVEKPRGTNGFGFDPIFVPEGHDKTFAEDIKYKMEVSHRRKAFNDLFEEISKKLSDK